MDIEKIKELGIEDDDLANKLVETVEQEVSGLKRNADSILSEKKKLADQLKQFDGVDPEEYRTLKQKMQEIEQKQLQGETDPDKLLQKLEEKYRPQIEAKDKELERIKANWIEDRRKNAISDAVSKHGANPHTMPRFLDGFVEAIDKDGEVVLSVLSDDGTPILGEDGKPMSVSAFVESLKGKEEYAGLFPPSGLSGGGATNTSGRPAGKTMKRESFDKLDHAARHEFVKGGGKIVD